MDLAGAIFCDIGTRGQAAVQIPSMRGEAGVFLLDMQTNTLRSIAVKPAERINTDFFDQNVACAKLRDQF